MHGPVTVPEAAKRILREVFGYETFRPGQESVISAVLSGHNILAVMPTGAGKSLCFQIPALVMDGLTVVVSPLVALMQDQVAALRITGVAVDSINSANSRSENVDAWRRVAAGRTRLLYMAPERLMTERMIAALSRLPVRLFAIDEAHCISQWGPAFRPEYEELCSLRELFPDTPVMALTATADEVTREDIAERMFSGSARTFVLGFNRPNIKLVVEPKDNWKKQLLDFMDRHRGESGIVYCLSRRKTEEIAGLLSGHGIDALPYHAGMDQGMREAHQNDFMTRPGIVIVATIAFGMGIDKPDVRYVFHTDLPGSVEAYYQEIGRAGRDGAPAEAHMLYGLADIRMRRLFIEDEDVGEERKRREHHRLDALLGYCDAPTCRRVALLSYFGEQAQSCGNCDTCLDPKELKDGTRDALKVLSAVERSGQRFGAAHVVDILRGKASEKVVRMGHDRLPVFGAGTGHGEKQWRSLIRQMVAANFLRLDIAGFGGLAISGKGHSLLHGDGVFRYREDRVVAGSSVSTRKIRTRSPRQSETVLAGSQQELLDALKELRLQLAQERGVPAYVVFHDRSLMEMAIRKPRTEEEFAVIHGIGEAKLRKFAEPFLELMNRKLSGVDSSGESSGFEGSGP